VLLACAAKSSACHPLMLPPHAALAAVLETRGQYSSAAAALQYCLALLQAGVLQGMEGLAALGMAGFSAQRPKRLTHQLLLLQPGDLHCSEASVNPESVTAVLELSLARNLALAGTCDEALKLYHKLEDLGVLSKECSVPGSAAAVAVAGPYDWICYGFAAEKLGQVELSQRALEQAVQVAELQGDEQSRLHTVMALLQVRRGCASAAG
jgi:tetratricopeptide (TPR) repeat protein